MANGATFVALDVVDNNGCSVASFPFISNVADSTRAAAQALRMITSAVKSLGVQARTILYKDLVSIKLIFSLIKL